ncbi:MAG: C39 family peptidase [Ruminococcus callidus]|uniref:C39 family peptidase n=1 Tax=Ruminococcus callidus TaxID=40519 RepID=UPI002E78D30E|nr:C39 family peptidase [Ruminococcus callidus]MEE0506274.1 C39 family peptidase [Ruminococcus callidus]
MAKVSKKQLGRRRRTALLLLLALIAAAVYLLFFRSDSSRNVPTKETTAALQSTAMTETTTTEEIGVLYQGTIPVQTELTVPTEPAVLTASQVELDAQPVLQNPELPTGCEVTSLTAALNYLGYPVDKLTMADRYLTRAEPYQATFGEAFIGSPHDANAWGCYAPVIVETAQKYLDEQGNGEVAQNLTGCSLKTLLWEVANGNPVITWVTINLTSRVEERYYWTTPKGEDAVFLINEHCVLLCGYDLNANTVTVCDPLEGKIQYDMDKFENRYQLVYQQAVVLRKPESLTGTETETETTEMFVQ